MQYRMLLLSSLSLVVSLAVSACAVGQRPTLSSTPRAIDAEVKILDDLFADRANEFTLEYTITPTNTAVAPRNAKIVHAGNRTRITIGAVDYFIDGVNNVTCIDNMAKCTAGIDDAFVSDLNLTHQFFSTAFRTRLLVDSGRNIGPTQGYDAEIAGRDGDCAAVQIIGGTNTYCVIDLGVLGRYIGADTSIELTAASATADESVLDQPTSQ